MKGREGLNFPEPSEVTHEFSIPWICMWAFSTLRRNSMNINWTYCEAHWLSNLWFNNMFSFPLVNWWQRWSSPLLDWVLIIFLHKKKPKRNWSSLKTRRGRPRMSFKIFMQMLGQTQYWTLWWGKFVTDDLLKTN